MMNFNFEVCLIKRYGGNYKTQIYIGTEEEDESVDYYYDVSPLLENIVKYEIEKPLQYILSSISSDFYDDVLEQLDNFDEELDIGDEDFYYCCLLYDTMRKGEDIMEEVLSTLDDFFDILRGEMQDIKEDMFDDDDLEE